MKSENCLKTRANTFPRAIKKQVMHSHQNVWHIVVVVILSSFVYIPETVAFLSQSHVKKFSLGVSCRSSIGNRIKGHNAEMPWDGGNGDGNTNDGNGWNQRGGGGSGGSGGGGGGGGGGDNGDNGGYGNFSGEYGKFILGSLPIALSKKFKEDVKRKAVSTVTNFSSSQLVLSSTVTSPVASRGKLVIHRPNISTIQHFQQMTKIAVANSKSRTSDLLKWYVSALDKNPLLVKSISSGVVSVCSDFAAQVFERSKCSPHVRKNKDYDKRRLTASFVEGLFISGPLMHFGYNYFENLIPIHGSRSNQNIAAIAHVLADSIILDSIFVATKIFTTGVLEGHSVKEDIVPQFQNDYIDTMKTSWLTSTSLLPLEFACFRLLPTSLRPLSMDMTSVVWDGVISYKAHEARHS